MIKLTEIVSKYKIYCDMDGVLTDFDEMFLSLLDNREGLKSGWDYQDKYGDNVMWKVVDTKGGLKFWSHMLWLSDGKKLWNYISKYDNTEILSSPSRLQDSKTGKKIWVQRELRLSNGRIPKLNLYKARYKQQLAKKNHILIDDLEENISQWKNAGGIGILHISANDTIEQLKQLGI